MSAPLSMCRTLIFVLALAAWAGIAHGATQAMVKPQRIATAARTTAAAKASRPAAASKTTASRTAATRSSAKSGTSAKPKTAAKTRSTSAKTRTAKAASTRRTATRPAQKPAKTNSASKTIVTKLKPVPASARLARSAPKKTTPAVAKKLTLSRTRRPVVRRASLRIPMAPPLRGSAEILAHQNTQLEAEGLERIVDDADLDNRIQQNLLVPLPASAALAVNPGLPENRRYCRSWTAQFLEDLARAHTSAFHKPLMVSSAVRTIEYQKHLMRTNRNAAAAEGDIVSPHVMGATIDIAKRGLTRQEISWLRTQLRAQVAAGNIDVEEEFRQACFHITVYRSYANPPDSPAPEQPDDSAALTETTAGQ